MLSNKWTFSLTSLVVMLALAFVVPSAMAAEFTVDLTVGPDVDISSPDNIQAAYGEAIEINIATGAVVQLAAAAATGATPRATARAATTLELLDFEVIAYNSFGGTVADPGLTAGTVTGVNPVTGVPTPLDAADGKSFVMNLASITAPDTNPLEANDITRVLIFIPKHAFEVADPRAFLTDGARNDDGRSAEASITINYVREDEGDPRVLSIRRASDPLLPVTAATENVIIVLSEQPKAFTKDHVDAANATWVDPVALVALPEDLNGPDNELGNDNDAAGRALAADNMPSTGRDGMVYPYVLTITPKYENKNDIVVKVKALEDMVLPTAGKYTPPAREADYDEGMSKLTIKVGKEAPKAGTAGLPVVLAKELFIPTDGYLVVADEEAGSAIINPGGAKDAPLGSVYI